MVNSIKNYIIKSMISHTHICMQLCPSSPKISMDKNKETTIQVSGTLQVARLKQSDKTRAKPQ